MTNIEVDKNLNEKKNIYQILPKKYFELDTREYRLLKFLFTVIEDKGYVAGGFAREIVFRDKIYSDIDVYPKDNDTFIYLKNQFDSLFKFRKNSKFAFEWKIKFEDKEEILTIIKPLECDGVNLIQNKIENLLDNFDFNIVKVGFYLNKYKELVEVCADIFWLDNLHKRINLDIRRPIPTIIYRVNKYMKKGFSLMYDDKIKLTKLWNEKYSDKFKITDISLKSLKDAGVISKRINLYEQWAKSIFDGMLKMRVEAIKKQCF